jgi:hypothetical protein
MKGPALVAVDRGPGEFAPLFAAARAAGERIGWLDLSGGTAEPVPAELEEAAGLGALRAVAVARGRTVVVKPVAGPSVLRDLLREHFRGCVAVLVRGLDGWPRLRPAGEDFELSTAADRTRTVAAVDLVARLRRPRHRAREAES